MMQRMNLRRINMWFHKYSRYANPFELCRRQISLAHNIIHGDSHDEVAPILLIHGLLGNKRNFNFISSLIRTSLPKPSIITCDVRNHGDSPHSDTMDYSSMRDDILELLQKCNVKECFLLGHSLGGRIAMHVALHRPEMVKKLIVVDVAPGKIGENRSVTKGAFAYIHAMQHVDFDNTLPNSKAKAHVEKQLESVITEKSVRDFVLTNFVKKASGMYGWRVNVDGILRNRLNLSHIGESQDFIPYERETLFIGGELSDYIRSDDIPEMRRLFPNSVIKYIANCGHWVHADDPRGFSEVVSNFILDCD